VSSTLEKITTKMNEGKFREALETVQVLLKETEIEERTRYEAQKLYIILLRRVDEISESLNQANNLIKQFESSNNFAKLCEILLLKSRNYIELIDWEEFEKLIKEIDELIEKAFSNQSIEYAKFKGDSLYLKGIFHLRNSSLSEAFRYSVQSLEFRDKTESKEEICYSLDILATICFWLGYIEEGIHYAERALKIFEDYDNPLLKLEILNFYSNLLTHKGNYELALKIRHENLKLAKELELEGEFYRYRIVEVWQQCYLGNFAEAEKIALESLNFLKEEELEGNFSLGHNFLSLAQIALGKYEEALENAKEALKIADELDNNILKAMAYARIGEVYRRTGEVEKALEYRLINVEYFEYYVNPMYKSHVLVDLIEIYLEKDNKTEAEKYLELMKDCFEEEKTDYIRHKLIYSEAVIYMKNASSRERGKGEILLEKLLEEEEVEYSIKIKSLFSLCSFLLTEFQIFGEDEVLIKFNKYLNQLIKIAEERQFFHLLVEIYILQSKLASTKMEIKEAHSYLEKALNLADSEEYEELSKRVKNEQTLLNSRLKSWREMISEEKPLVERLKTVNINETMSSMKKQVEKAIVKENGSDPSKLTKIFSLRI
jgi:tetratricopeptide (TPR) repeat protein